MTPSGLSSLMIFFFNDTATTEIYTLSLHDALPILVALLKSPLHRLASKNLMLLTVTGRKSGRTYRLPVDRKSTRLNSSHDQISYAVFCLKKKKKKQKQTMISKNINHTS